MASEYTESEQAAFDSAMSGSITSTEPVKVNNTQQPDSYGVSNIYSIRSIQFPADIDNVGDNGFQRHFTRFTINIDEESRLIKRDKAIATDVDNSDQNRFRTGNTSQNRFVAGVTTAGVATALGSTFAGKAIGKQKGILNKALVAVGVGAAAAGASAYVASKFDVTKKLKKLASTITLYTPGNISTRYGIDYSITEDMTNDLLNTDRGMELLKDTKTGEQSTLGGIGKVGRILATASSEIIQNVTRTARNPKKDMLFKQVDQRSFQFDYTFMPKNAMEAYDVANIIYMFKFFAHPEMLEGFDQFLYIYPAEFDIEYIYKVNKEENQNIWLNKISSCVLESIEVNYGSTGTFQSLVGGEPVITTMTLRFREIETLHQGRIADGY